MKILVCVACFTIALLLLVTSSNAVTPVLQCSGGKSPENVNQIIDIQNCRKVPCKLKKGTNTKAEFRFTPSRDVKSLLNSVHAVIVGLPFPFIGVDNTDACGNIFEADGTTQAPCPLKAGKEYVYKNGFDILPFYPTIKAQVHWGLTAEDGQDVLCFEVPIRIAN